jgi:hypothetical protein
MARPPAWRLVTRCALADVVGPVTAVRQVLSP